jgi:hypothetical protein
LLNMMHSTSTVLKMDPIVTKILSSNSFHAIILVDQILGGKVECLCDHTRTNNNASLPYLA